MSSPNILVYNYRIGRLDAVQAKKHSLFRAGLLNIGKTQGRECKYALKKGFFNSSTSRPKRVGVSSGFIARCVGGTYGKESRLCLWAVFLYLISVCVGKWEDLC